MLKRMEFEVEVYDEQNAVDTVWVQNGRGEMVKLEVEDDASDD